MLAHLDDVEMDLLTKELEDREMSEHIPDTGAPTPGGSFSDFDREWRKGIWSALKELKEGQKELTKSISQITLGAEGTKNSIALCKAAATLELNTTASTLRVEMENKLKERDAEIQRLHDFKIRITTAFIVIQIIFAALTALGFKYFH